MKLAWNSWNIQALLIRYAPWTVFLVIPLLVNVFIWKSLAYPARMNLKNWQDSKNFMEIKPRFTAGLAKSQAYLAGWEKNNFSKDDPAAAIEIIERIAGQNRVEIKTVHSAEPETKPAKPASPSAAPGFLTLSLRLEMAGSFDRLARFINDIENQTSLQMSDWSLSASSSGEPLLRLSTEVTVHLRKTP